MVDLCTFLYWLRDNFSLVKLKMSQTCSFSPHKKLIDGLELCGLLVNYCDGFIQPRLIGNTHLFLQNWKKKRTYMYQSLQFPVEMNTRGSVLFRVKLWQLFSHKVWFTGTEFWLKKLIFTQLPAKYNFKTIVSSCAIWKVKIARLH